MRGDTVGERHPQTLTQWGVALGVAAVSGARRVAVTAVTSSSPPAPAASAADDGAQSFLFHVGANFSMQVRRPIPLRTSGLATGCARLAIRAIAWNVFSDSASGCRALQHRMRAGPPDPSLNGRRAFRRWW
jgi:hypothetical protein